MVTSVPQYLNLNNFLQSSLAKVAWYGALSAILWFVLIEPRGLGIHSISESLWTEDALIFLNQRFSIGLQSVVVPYQGYLLFFPRLFVIPASLIPLSWLPHLLFVGWCLAFCILAYVLQRRLSSRGFSDIWISIVLITVALQPHAGEVLFSITNAQWVLGLALAVYVCLPAPDSKNPIELFVLLVASLTGPFGLLLSPILALQCVVRRDLFSRGMTYLIVAFAAAVQLSILMSSQRLSSSVSKPDDVYNWVSVIRTLFTFGSANQMVVLASVAFWCLLAYGFLRWALERERSDGDAIYLFSAAAILFGTSAYSVSLWMSVTGMSPIGGGSRYFFVPYGLLFVGTAVVLHRFLSVHLLATALVAVICILSFGPATRENMQWQAFAKFASVRAGTDLPINPQWASEPTWSVLPPPKFVTAVASSFSVPFGVTSDNGKSKVSINLDKFCAASSTVGLEFDVSRNDSGLAQLVWGADKSLAVAPRQLYRYYRAGSVKMLFAVTRLPNENFFELSLGLGPNAQQATVNSATVYCL